MSDFTIQPLSGGKSKDPASWAATSKTTPDVTDLNIPGITAGMTAAQILAKVETLATDKATSDSVKTLRNTLIGYKGNYTANQKKLAWTSKDTAALKETLGLINAHNVALPKEPLTLAQWQSHITTTPGFKQAFTARRSIPAGILTKGSTATPEQQISDILHNYIIPKATQLGSNLSTAQLQKIASDAFHNGTYKQTNVMDQAILDHTDIAKTIATDGTTGALGGAIGSNANDARTIFHNYGIPAPKDPNQFAAFIKNAVGVGGNLNKITEYAKAQAVLLYPYMKGFLTGADGSTSEGGTVAGYLAPFTNNIAAVGGIDPKSIDWTNPKWQAVITSKDPKTGINVPNSVDKAIEIYKSDPSLGFDTSVNGINDGFAQVRAMKSAMGM